MELNDDWYRRFSCSFTTEEEVIEFIFERLNTSDFQDSYVDVGGFGEANEMFKITAQDKRESLYEFMMYLANR